MMRSRPERSLLLDGFPWIPAVARDAAQMGTACQCRDPMRNCRLGKRERL